MIARSLSTIVAVFLLATFFALTFFSSWNDSAIFDETAHIGAAYSYVSQKDMRLNPEHPPLMKDLAGIPLLLLHLNFRTDTDAWQNQINGQWDQGAALLYDFGNDADQILRYARFPIMLLAVLFGIFLFAWTRNLFGNMTAVLALSFYVFSPTIIAHSRFVTTDIAAAFAFFIGIVSFVRFLEKQTRSRMITAGIAFGIAELFKFSLVLLAPIYLILAGTWLIVAQQPSLPTGRWRRFMKDTLRLFGNILLIFIIGGLIIWAVYVWHVWNYPPEKQLNDAKVIIGNFKIQSIAKFDLWLIQNPLTRPLGQYLFGVLMVTQRTAGGNTAYFFGEVSSKGWLTYFPAAYLLKETLAFHILTLIALFVALGRVFNAREKSLFAVREWLAKHFAVFASLFFVVFYWASSIANPLNIGVRHVLPTFPFIYLLVSRELVMWIKKPALEKHTTMSDWFYEMYHLFIAPIPKILIISIALMWMSFSVLINFPYYLSYFNELVGGTANGHWYITDSNYDWGQDLKRLRDFANQHPNETIYLDYFGGGRPSYYLKDQYKPWYSSFGLPPSGSIFAVSANSIRGNQAHYHPSVTPPKYEDTYPWLRGLEPFGRAGTSIFLYRIP